MMTPRFGTSLLLFGWMLLSCNTASAQQPAMVYHLAWGPPNAHYFEIKMEVSDHVGETIDFRIPDWRPGRYVFQNYAQNIIAFQAEDGEGHALPVRKVNKDTWRVEKGQADNVSVSYECYARQLDAGASYLDDAEAYLNPITCLMNVPGRDREPVALTIHKPDDWRVATPLDYDAVLNGYPAKDYHELVDSPFLISPSFELLSFEESGATIEIAIQGEWEYDEALLIEDHRRIVRAQVAMMQHIPFDRYLFMYHITHFPMGHGVEHKNSTSIVLGPGDRIVMPNNPAGRSFYAALLGVASHEFFHLWNVERIRPASMYPPDYSVANYTTQMWIYEGVTDYFSDLLLLRAGLITPDNFLGRMAGTIRSFQTNPGRKVTSIAMSSYDSWTKQGNAPPHTFYSFYTAGKIMGLLLDLEVRGRTRNSASLDDVMRYLYETYPAQDRGVPEDGFQKALESITGSSFQDFFDAYIYGTEEIDYAPFLAHAGLVLERSVNPQLSPVTLGIGTDDNTITTVFPESGAFRAGLDIDDVLLKIDTTEVQESNIGTILQSYAPGDDVEVTVRRRGHERTFTVTLDAREPNIYRLSPMETITPLQDSIRADWLRQ
ncbi:MAG: M61 family metallopeptidase [Rhodothermales bacterium]